MTLLVGVSACSLPGNRASPTSPVPASPVSWSLDDARGFKWTLTRWSTPSGTKEVPGNVTFELLDDGRIAGRAPVNRYFGRIVYVGTEITSWDPVGSTKMAGPEAAMQAETAYFADLVQVRSARSSEGRLILSTPQGTTLEFSSPSVTPPLAASSSVP
ncbi:MAG TPA: META domain-containing protein [Opitutaceae bacterium]|nr:META domain-containing protein [Opitutaceae bacterium]